MPHCGLFDTAVPADERSLQAYLLGSVDFEAAVALQKRLVYEVSGERDRAALVLCEHPPLITVGRAGSRAHILLEPEELAARGWRVRWVNRGGGALLHLPGQVAVYPVVALDRLGLGLDDYLARLTDVLRDTLADFTVRAEPRGDRPGLWVGGRPIVLVGAAVTGWVAYHGAVLNVHPDLELLRKVRTGPDEEPMTSLERERRGPLRPALVRERLVAHFARRFGFERVSALFQHPALAPREGRDVHVRLFG